MLSPGEILKVPVSDAYVAQNGDTLSEVARRFAVPEDELAELNHISARHALWSGEKIGLPSSMHDRGPLRNADYGGYAYGGPSHRGYGAETPLYASPSPGAVPSAPYMAPPPARAIPEALPALSDAQITQATKGKFVWPLHGEIAAAFGPRGVGERNDGIDIKASPGASVQAAASGKVVYAGDQVKGGFGNLVLIEHADGWFTAYAHLDKISVHMMDQVTQGQEVGVVGMTGDAKEPELHFEIRFHPAPGVKTQPVNPVLALPSS
jgi:murein DD-endopeptidase MepM/ murein hydrolase activator NlpD